MPKHRPARAVLVPAAGASAAAAALLLAAPTPAAALRQLRTGTAADPTAPLVAALTLGAQALVLWLAVIVLLTLAARLPGLPGRAFALLGRRAAPLAVRHAVEVALGITVAVGVVGAVPAAAATAPLATSASATVGAAASHGPGAAPAWTGHGAGEHAAPRPGAVRGAALGSTVGAPVPDLDWPDPASAAAIDPAASPPPSAPRVWPTSGPTAAPAAPERTSAPQAQPPVAPGAQPSPGGPAGLPRAGRPEAARAAAPTSVVVRPGDTLWDLAEQALAQDDRPPTARQVAQSWPRWWAANREVIGPDPDLLHPGTRLSPPAPPGGPPAG